jgi:hypothetical protein
MTNFFRLNRQMRAYALVGSFLQTWSFMEGALNSVIGTALSLKITTEAILCQNIQFRDKIHILRTLISISPLPTVEKKRIDRILNKLAEYSKYRNVIAHNPFGPSQVNDGVQFNVIRARGSLQLPELDWAVAQFEEHYQTIVDFSNELEALEEKLRLSMRR